MSEAELIQRVLAGDPAAERQLYDLHVDRVYRLAFRLANGEQDLAQDFTQEAFLRAFDRLPEFQQRSAFSTWLHAITVSVSLNGLRKLKRHRQRETDLDEAALVIQGGREAEPDLKTRLKRAIQALPEHYPDSVSVIRCRGVYARRDRQRIGSTGRHIESAAVTSA